MKKSRKNKKSRDQFPGFRPPGEGVPVALSAFEEKGRGLFSPTFLHEVAATAETSFRRRILSIEVVLLALVYFVQGRLKSFQAIVDRLRSGDVPGLMAAEVTPSAFYKRLRAIPHTLFLQLLRHTTAKLSSAQKHWRSSVFDLYASEGTRPCPDLTAAPMLTHPQMSRVCMEARDGEETKTGTTKP